MVSRNLNWVFPLWLYASMAFVFSALMSGLSSGAQLNIFDALITLPSLFVLAPLMILRRFIDKRFALAVAPFACFVALAVLSLVWADSPNVSRTFRAAAQVSSIFVLFSYLYFTGNSLLLKRALFYSCVFVAILCAWHLTVMYLILGLPWANVLYQGADPQALSAFGVKPLNPMHATLLIAPQAAMLLGMISYSGPRGWVSRLLGATALFILLVFLVSLERRTGQVAIVFALLVCAVLYRQTVWYLLLGAAALSAGFILMFMPEFILNRGVSWRPEIWTSTLESIRHAPIFGHGITNTIVPVEVKDYRGGVASFRHPHNLPLAVAYFMGTVGLVFWVLIWAPGLLEKITRRELAQRDAYIVLPMLVGLAVLMFDGESPLSPLHYEWFCFWLPAMLILASHAAGGKRLVPGNCDDG